MLYQWILVEYTFLRHCWFCVRSVACPRCALIIWIIFLWKITTFNQHPLGCCKSLSDIGLLAHVWLLLLNYGLVIGFLSFNSFYVPSLVIELSSSRLKWGCVLASLVMAEEEHGRQLEIAGHLSPEAAVFREPFQMLCRDWPVWNQPPGQKVSYLKHMI